MVKITKRKFLKALKGTAGILTQVAKNMDVSRNAVHEYINRTPEVKPLTEQEREQILDIIEGSLINRAVKGEDLKAQMFYLKTIGRKRGYVEKTETELSGGADNNFTFEIITPKE